jgi:hypothetical protein
MKVGSIETFHDLPKELPPAPQPLQLPAGNNPNVPTELTATSSPDPASADDLAREAPIGAVIAAWVRLEEAVYRGAERLQITSGEGWEPTKSIPSLLKRMNIAGAIDSERLGAILTLREIRNRVVHFVGEPATADQAADYRDVVDKLVRRVAIGTENVRIQSLLKELDADAASKITVGPLATIGVSGAEEAAKAMAHGRRENWGAKSGSVTMMVSQDDAALLLQYGATYEPGMIRSARRGRREVTRDETHETGSGEIRRLRCTGTLRL